MEAFIKPPFILELEKLGIKVLYPLDTVIYKYVPLDIALLILKSNSLKFSAPSTFNDPFDLNNALIDKSYTKDDLKNWFNLQPDMANSKKKELYNKVRNNPAEIKKMLDLVLNDFKTQTGVTCFSKSFKKTLMWSHYANKHSGICLGFNIFPVSDGFTLLEVNDADEIKPLNYFQKKSIALMYWLYTKSSIWSYEEEVRAVYAKRNGLLKFDLSSLREIHYGLRTTIEERKEIQELVSEKGYNITKETFMTMNSRTFDLKENIQKPLFR